MAPFLFIYTTTVLCPLAALKYKSLLSSESGMEQCWRTVGTIILCSVSWVPGQCLMHAFFVFLFFLNLCNTACILVWRVCGKSSQPGEQRHSGKCLFSSWSLLKNTCLFFLSFFSFVTPCRLSMALGTRSPNTTKELDPVCFLYKTANRSQNALVLNISHRHVESPGQTMGTTRTESSCSITEDWSYQIDFPLPTLQITN